MSKQVQHTIFTPAIGASLAVLFLISIAFIPFVEGVGYPGVNVLTGQTQLSSDQFTAYVCSIYLDLFLDTFFLIGCILAWIGLFYHIHQNNKLIAALMLILALLGIGLDFTENTFIAVTLNQLINGLNPGDTWYTPWHISQQASYWLAFIPAALASIILWKGDFWEKVLAFCGSVLLFPAMLGMFIPALEMVSIVWYLFWFAFAAVILWRRFLKSSNHSINKENSHG
jgi:hypothetical protein